MGATYLAAAALTDTTRGVGFSVDVRMFRYSEILPRFRPLGTRFESRGRQKSIRRRDPVARSGVVECKVLSGRVSLQVF